MLNEDFHQQFKHVVLALMTSINLALVIYLFTVYLTDVYVVIARQPNCIPV